MFSLKTSTIFLLIILSSTILVYGSDESKKTYDNLELKNYLKEVNKNLAILYNKQVELTWENEVIAIEDENLKEEKSQEITKKIMEYVKLVKNELKKYQNNPIGIEPIIKRQIEKLPNLGYEVLSSEDFDEITKATMNMSLIYKTIQMCSYKNQLQCNLTLIPDVQNILHSTNDVKEIEYYWLEWRTKSGLSVKDSFEKFVKLYKKTSELNGYNKPSKFWYRNFDESEQILPELDNIIEQLHSQFLQLHAHVRNLLRIKYGKELVKINQPYPQHLAEIFIGAAYLDQDGKKLQLPYPNKSLPNITAALIEKNYSPEKFFKLTEEFFVSIGLPPLQESFWMENAKQKLDTEEKYLTCWNKAYNFYESDSVTLSYCPQVDQRRYINMFETMTDIYSYKLFKNEPTVFQDEPLPEFNSAIGSIFTNAASTPKYLEKLGIIEKGVYDFETRINRLYFQGLQEIFLLPILYTLDKYRVEILNNETHSWENCAYWKLNEKYTGAMAPVKRTNQNFDAPSKLLLGVTENYSGIIMSKIIQYQIYKSFCKEIKQYERGNPNLPLDNCDLSGHPEIGRKLKKAMSLGASKPWKYVLEILTGEKELNPSGFLEYFEPLIIWLRDNNQKNGIEVGWKESNQCEN